MKYLETGLSCAFVLIFAAVVSLILTFPIMWLWNWLMPELFSLPVLDFWHTFGLLLLIRWIIPTGSSSSSK
jgi:hypothetical protein